ncbi:CdaR family protein [soil metagenome]
MKVTSLPLAIASLLLSLILWLYVFPQNLDENIPRQVSVKLSYTGLPDGMTVTRIPDTVLLTAKGEVKALDALVADPQLEAVVPLGAAKPGRQRYPVTITPGRYKDFFEERQYAWVETEEIATRKIAVEVETRGQLSDETLALDDALIDPPIVEVRGPRSVIDRIAKARVPFDLRAVTLTTRDPQYPAVEALFANGAVAENVSLDPKIVKVTPIVSSSPQQKQISILTQIISSPAVGYIMAGYEISPPLVSIRGSSRALAGITQISTEPLDISGITKTTEFTVNLKVPKGITVSGTRVVHVKVMVNPAPATNSSTP